MAVTEYGVKSDEGNSKSKIRKGFKSNVKSLENTPNTKKFKRMVDISYLYHSCIILVAMARLKKDMTIDRDIC